MLSVLKNRAYAKLFSAQIIALVGTGLLTVALGLLAFDIAGGNAGLVLGIAMAVKMVAYVGVSPFMAAWVVKFPAKRVLICADIIRAAIALCLPFVTQTWQIYILIFVLQSASATFTPTFQALIPSVLPDEAQYTRALSLSRLAYDLENIASPMLAAFLLTITNYHNLFAGTVVGFICSAALVSISATPARHPADSARQAPFTERLTEGMRTFSHNRELRALMGLNLVEAAVSAMVIINTVVLVQGDLGRSQSAVAVLLAANGCGSMLVALCLPRLLDKCADRVVMLSGAAALPAVLFAVAAVLAFVPQVFQWPALLVLWFLIGASAATILTPSSRLLRRNSTEDNRSAVFAAQFSLSHACYLLAYPIAGVLGSAIGLAWIAVVLALLGMVGTLVAVLAWPSDPCGAGVVPPSEARLASVIPPSGPCGAGADSHSEPRRATLPRRLEAHSAHDLAQFTLRLDVESKQQADRLFSELGLTTDAAVNLFLRQSLRDGGLPFTPRVSEDSDLSRVSSR